MIGSIRLSRVTDKSAKFGRRSRNKPIESQPADLPPQPSRIQLDIFQVNCTAESLSEFQLDRVTNGSPSIEEILKRLNTWGIARIAGRIDSTTDLSAEVDIRGGQRIPVIMDVHKRPNGQTRPSISYHAHGSIVYFKPTQWNRTVTPSYCTTAAGLEYTGFNETGVEAAKEVNLPEFLEMKLEQQLRLQSGIPQYFTMTGCPVPPNKSGKTAITFMCLVVTDLGK